MVEAYKRKEETERLNYLRRVPAFKVISYRQFKSMYKHFTTVIKKRGTELYRQGQKADYIYIVKKGELSRTLRQFFTKPNFKDTNTRAIFEQPWQANSQHSGHMTKN